MSIYVRIFEYLLPSLISIYRQYLRQNLLLLLLDYQDSVLLVYYFETNASLKKTPYSRLYKTSFILALETPTMISYDSHQSLQYNLSPTKTELNTDIHLHREGIATEGSFYGTCCINNYTFSDTNLLF